MRYITPNKSDSNLPIGNNYCILDANTLVSYDTNNAYYYVRASSSQGDWVLSRNYRYRDNLQYYSNPCNGYYSYNVTQQYTPLDFSSSVIMRGGVVFALLSLPIIGIIICSRVWRLYRHRD